MTSKKKKILGIIIGIIIILFVADAVILFGIVGIDKKQAYSESEAVNANVQTGVTVIDKGTTYQTMNGFGASACWWAQQVGEWENCEEIISYLYDGENGIGLNIYRYNLGAGTKNDEHLYVYSNRTESFMNEDGTYNFNADAAAQNCLLQAKKHAGNDLRVTLFCNSPPTALTRNGAGYCSAEKEDDAPWISNLAEENYEAFADYCYNSSMYFINNGYRVTDVSPINEPESKWRAWYNEDGTYSMSQEGCYYSKYNARDLMNVMVERFDGSEADEKGCKVSMFEATAFEGKGTTPMAYVDCLLGKGPKYVFNNIKLRRYFDDIAFHSYWSSTETKQEAAEYLKDKYSNYGIHCTEYCQMNNDGNTGVYDLICAEENGTNGLTIEYGTAMAKVIIDDLTIMNAKEWDWWLGCSYGTYTDGLVYIDAENHSSIQTSKRLWCLGNFSKFIEEGATRIACSSGVDGLETCAFINEDGSLVIVYVNNTDEDLHTEFDASSDYEIYTTSEQYNLEKTSQGNAGNAQIDAPAKSVVTLICK